MSSSYINEFYERVKAVVSQLTDDYEIIMVDDGSPDDSLVKAKELCAKDSKVVVVELSRNFGHHKAMMTGLAHAKGERVFLLDSDLEEQPEWLSSFSEQMDKEDCDVVYGVQEKRKGNKFEQLTGELFYRLFNKVTGVDLPRNIVTARLMTYDYVRALVSFSEHEIFLAGIWHITGFKQSPQVITKFSTSETTYTIRHKMAVVVNSVTSFSHRPLSSIFYFGLVVFMISTLYICYLSYSWLFSSKPLTGWTSVMASIWLLGGLIISFIGIVGIYLSKIYSESKGRPYTIIRRIHGRTE